ncbi:hypothetical protein SAMN02745216_02069 [Desulfatibacillum alkenivorans DSM 16219]|uniref:Immunity protein Imm33 domain-containing protein n=1 Tax=Desulfatibacillum alkenivorans DSM 16219 TaxID=1121393 RepID=A0A1M6L969_9BACT|nr:DUF3239 domain-containing protein [Desulfatibacillum alkenivorans]SHJ67746.1 hypothetical protein SAMN02745216_02069 [Desulfatibacillum alkenivorans DSM 16219]
MDTDLLCLASRNLAENGWQAGRFFHRKDLASPENGQSGWIFIEDQEDEEWLSDPDNYIAVPLSKIILNNPGIRAYLDKSGDREFQVNPRTGDVQELERLKKFSYTAASRPGRLVFNPIALMNVYPKSYLFFGIWCFFLFAAVMGVWPAWIFSAAGAAGAGFIWRRLHLYFKYGDANPGVIIAVNPVLMAVATDLQKRSGRYPVVAVREVKIRKIDKIKVEPGMRLATVSLYTNGDEAAPYWTDFDPFPAQYATLSSPKIAALFERFSQQDWDDLEEAVAQIPKPCTEGLYPLDVENSDWKDYKDFWDQQSRES